MSLASRRLAIFLPGIFITFLLFSNFLLLFAQSGGAIANYGTLHVTLANFTRNQADIYVSRAAPELSCRLAISLVGISQLFCSFLTFLLLFAQYGGAIYNNGILTVEHGIFTGNSADGVCIIAPRSQCSQLAISLLPILS
jgi:hypothetical protein